MDVSDGNAARIRGGVVGVLCARIVLEQDRERESSNWKDASGRSVTVDKPAR